MACSERTKRVKRSVKKSTADQSGHERGDEATHQKSLRLEKLSGEEKKKRLDEQEAGPEGRPRAGVILTTAMKAPGGSEEGGGGGVCQLASAAKLWDGERYLLAADSGQAPPVSSALLN